MRKMNAIEFRELLQLTNDYVFKFKNDEYIDTFDVFEFSRDYVRVIHECNNELQIDTLNVQFMRAQLNNKLTLIKS